MATERLCSVEGCGKLHEARGWCNVHYERWRKTGDIELRPPPPPKRGKCAAPGCDGKLAGRGYCSVHYQRLKRTGDPLRARSVSPKGTGLAWATAHIGYQGEECLIWPFGRTCGRGAFYEEGKQKVASRWMCEKVHGDPPSPDYEAAHNCGNGHLGCVNGRHLYWATPAQNAADRWAHGTQPHGEGAPNVRLTESEVLSIYAMRGVKSHEALAKQFGVTKGAIGCIMSGRSWNWLTKAASDDRYSAWRSQKRVGRSRCG